MKPLHPTLQPTTKCECLDFVEAAHSDRVYPTMQCHLEIDGTLDGERLIGAISQSAQYVPEILCAFDFKRGRFVNQGISADKVLATGPVDASKAYFADLSQNPQLQVIRSANEQKNVAIFVISHILTDGMGFLQYLYLLASLYNGEQPNPALQNFRAITPILKNIHVRPPTEQTRHGKQAHIPPLRPLNDGKEHCCLKVTIASDDLDALHRKAKQYGATLNDVFVTAYARVIAQLHSIDTVVIPCPVNLRNFQPMVNGLTIANMTGMYKRITIEVRPEDEFTAILLQTHVEIALQKSRHRCFAGIQPLHFAFRKIPYSFMRSAIKTFYPIPPVSYTNIGVIDNSNLNFNGCNIKSCFFTGAFRQPPDFQLTISTFRNVCTLNCTLICETGDEKIGQNILEQIRQELLKWIQQ